MRIEFTEEARKHILSAVAHFHEEDAFEAAERFQQAVFDEAEAIAEAPQRWRELRPGVRSKVFAKPWRRYSLLYTIKIDRILVLAVAHHRRRPGYWAQ